MLVLSALAREAAGDPDAAAARLARATRLAEPDGQVRCFSRHGALVVPLLYGLADGSDATVFVTRLLVVCRQSAAGPPAVAGAGAGVEAAPGSARAGLVDPLSARELEVLHLLASDLGGPDIARHLFVSVNTLRTHTKNIYAKLGVTNRRAAVRRGRELGLVPG